MNRIEQPEHGSLLVEGIQSEALQGRASVWLYLPPGYDDQPDTRYRTLTLLHGAWGWEWDWPCKGAACETAGRMIAAGEIEPIIIAMPNDGLHREGTLYLNWADGSRRCEDWIARDLTAYLDANLRTKAEREARCISGLSMGGFGAMNIGLRNRTVFGSIASHSGFFSVVEEANLFWDQFHDQAIGSPDRARANSPLHYIGDIPEAELPRIRFDCGKDDFLFQPNEAMHARMVELGIEHTYEVYPGAHTWEYWTEHLKDSLRFHFGTARG